MTVGLGLIKSVIEHSRPLSSIAEEFGVDPGEMLIGDEKKVFDFVSDHFLTYGKLPEIKTVEVECKIRFANLEKEPPGYWANRVTSRYRANMLISTLKEAKALATSGDFEKAFDCVASMVSTLTMAKGIDRIYTLGAVATSVLEAHDKRQRSHKLSGIPFGLEFLDEISDGAQGGDTIALVGRPGVGKTYLLFKFALSAFSGGYIPLLTSHEMAVYQCARRLVALISHTPATSIRLGRLSFWGRNRLQTNIGELINSVTPLYLLQGSLETTVESIGTRVQEIKPHIVYIDGGYLIHMAQKHTSTWERVAAVAGYIKALSQSFNIPFVVTYQFNRRGPGSLGNIGHSDAVGQLASIVMSIENDDEGAAISWNALFFKLLTLMKGREGEKGKMRLLYDMERMNISQESVIAGNSDA